MACKQRLFFRTGYSPSELWLSSRTCSSTLRFRTRGSSRAAFQRREQVSEKRHWQMRLPPERGCEAQQEARQTWAKEEEPATGHSALRNKLESSAEAIANKPCDPACSGIAARFSSPLSPACGSSCRKPLKQHDKSTAAELQFCQPGDCDAATGASICRRVFTREQAISERFSPAFRPP